MAFKALSRHFASRTHASSNLKRALAQQAHRADPTKYSYLLDAGRFADLGDRLHPDL